MRENLARAMCLPEDCVNVKATTTEGMGFEGEGLGVSAAGRGDDREGAALSPPGRTHTKG